MLIVVITQAAQAAVPVAEHVPGHLVVRFRHGLRAVAGARMERSLGKGMYLLHSQDETPTAVAALAEQLGRGADIAWVELEHRRRINDVTPADPLYPMQWALPLIHAPSAWTRTNGSQRVVVAVLDTGYLPHPDLLGSFVPGYDFITDPSNGGDGDGRDSDAQDPGMLAPGSSGLHGLHVTGILGARSNNRAGIAGVDWLCRILPVRVLGVRGGDGDDSDIADAIRWAAGLPVDGVPDNPTPADVINMSFGGPGLSALLQAAVDDAASRGVVLVASAGNASADTADYAPAALNHVIAVGAVSRQGVLAGYSNRGPRVDLVAPGGDDGDPPIPGILSTLFLNDGTGWTYFPMLGTSQAAPHVAGTAALMRGVAPALSGDQILALLQSSADPAGRCVEGCGAGLLDTAAAVEAALATTTCRPYCGVGTVCEAGTCASVYIEKGSIVQGGCRAAGPDPGSASGLLGMLSALAVAGVLRVRRSMKTTVPRK